MESPDMPTPRRLLLATTLLTGAFALSVAVPADIGVGGAPAALAKSDNAGGNGNGNGADHGNGNGKSDVADNGRGDRGADKADGNGFGGGKGLGLGKLADFLSGKAAAPGQNKAAGVANAAPANAKVPGLDAKVASLHAVNANLQAYIHASPNSKVGMIAAYAASLVDVENAAAVRDAAQAVFDMADANLAAANQLYAEAMDALVVTYGYEDTSLEGLQARRDALAATDTSMMTADEIAALNAELMAVDEALAAIEEVAMAEAAYAEADMALAEAELALTEAEAGATTALDAAANDNRTPVDPEVKAYVDAKLEEGGILDYYRALAEASLTP
jgi:hypothetical protein